MELSTWQEAAVAACEVAFTSGNQAIGVLLSSHSSRSFFFHFSLIQQPKAKAKLPNSEPTRKNLQCGFGSLTGETALDESTFSKIRQCFSNVWLLQRPSLKVEPLETRDMARQAFKNMHVNPHI